MRQLPVRILSVLALLVAAAGGGAAYSTFAKWPSVPVPFFINPANADVTPAAATAAVQFAMNVWNTGGTTFRYQYGGPATDTAVAFDNRNVVFFRNESNGSVIATTYTWRDSNNQLMDADIIVWDGGFTFATGTSGCGPNGAYIEDIATHELGHALGLDHSASSDATMYPSYSYCSQAFRTLAPDDIAGLKALYPAAPANAAPVVTIASPVAGATFSSGAAIAFAGSATDAEDGVLSAQLQWTDNGTPIGSGTAFSAGLAPEGTHTIVARATDSGGLIGSRQITVTITPAISGGGTTVGTLTATKHYSTSGWERADLKWTGLPGRTVDLYRNGAKLAVVVNDGAQTDSIKSKGPGTYVYKLCAATTVTCTPETTVVF